jgi:hypothetical protein
VNRDIRIGDLVRLPTADRPRGVVGVVVDLTTRINEGLIGVSWPNTDRTVTYEHVLTIDVLG